MSNHENKNYWKCPKCGAEVWYHKCEFPYCPNGCDQGEDNNGE